MTTREVAEKLVAYCRQGDFESPYSELYSPEIVSVEPEGSPTPITRGFEELMAKGKAFEEMVETMHGNEVSDPIVAENFFSCTMKMDVTFRGGPRTFMEEICVYEVKDGKIVREQFFFTPQMEEA